MTTSTSHVVFWILTVLAGGRRHGYEIMLEAAAASGGRVSLRATTLYGALDRLERGGQISSDGEEVVNGRARRYYKITQAGAAQLAAEVELLESSAQAARIRLATGHVASLMSGLAVV